MAYSCIVVLRFVTRYSDTKIGIWRFLYRHDDLLKKRISDFLAIRAIKLDKKSPQIRQKSPKMPIFGDFYLFDVWNMTTMKTWETWETGFWGSKFLRNFLRNWFSLFFSTSTVGSVVKVSTREVPARVFLLLNILIKI